MIRGVREIAGILLVLFAAAEGAEGLVLAEKGKTSYAIVADESARKLDRLAVKELTEYFRKSTGAELKEDPAAATKKIFVGRTKEAVRLLGEKKVNSLQEDESLVATRGNDLFLIGGGRFGTVYAVYSFLENQLGIRWYDITGGEKVPKHDPLIIQNLNYTQKPHFSYRMITTSEYHRHPDTFPFLFRNRINMIWGNFKRKGAEKLEVKNKIDTPFSHSIHYYIPPFKGTNPYRWKWNEDKEYFKSNPEFFGMNQKGERVTTLQLCFSNPELRKEFTKRFKEHVDGTNNEVFQLSGSDWPGAYCYCPECRALEKKYGCVAGPFFDYLIELCNDLKNSYPQVLIVTSAYRKEQSENPPKPDMKFPDNFIIKLCPIDDDCTKNYEHKNNSGTYQNLKRWCRLTNNRTWVWYYPCYGGTPSADFERTVRDVRLMADAGCTGLCFEHDIEVFQGMGFSDMMTWVLTQVYQNPELDWKSLVREFAGFYYGKAAPEMLQYLFELQRIRTECKDFIVWDAKIQINYTNAQLLKWERMFDEMEKRVRSDATALHHVRDARINLDLLLLDRWNDIRKLSPSISLEALHKRILDNLDNSLARRYPQGNEDALRYWRKQITRRVEKAFMMASFTPKPLPPEFNSIPASKIHQTIPVSTPYAKVEKLPDAAYGIAMRDPKKRLEMPFTLGFKDQFNNKSILQKKWEKKDILIDRFHLYKLGTVTISQKCRLWLMQTWSAHVQLENFHRPGFPDKKWDLYISLKFEGPGYGSSKSKENNVWLDRIVLVELD